MIARRWAWRSGRSVAAPIRAAELRHFACLLLLLGSCLAATTAPSSTGRSGDAARSRRRQLPLLDAAVAQLGARPRSPCRPRECALVAEPGLRVFGRRPALHRSGPGARRERARLGRAGRRQLLPGPRARRAAGRRLPAPVLRGGRAARAHAAADHRVHHRQRAEHGPVLAAAVQPGRQSRLAAVVLPDGGALLRHASRRPAEHQRRRPGDLRPRRRQPARRQQRQRVSRRVHRRPRPRLPGLRPHDADLRHDRPSSVSADGGRASVETSSGQARDRRRRSRTGSWPPTSRRSPGRASRLPAGASAGAASASGTRRTASRRGPTRRSQAGTEARRPTSWRSSPTSPAETGPLPAATSRAPSQTQQLDDAISLAYCQPYVQAFFNFQLDDEESLAGWQAGLLYVGGVPKPSYDLFRTLSYDVRAGKIDCSRYAAAVRGTGK